MVSTFFRRLVPVLGVLLIAFLGVQGAYAQSDDRANTIEILGTVEEMTLSTITVNGLLINTSLAEIAVPLTLEQTVFVEGVLLPDGTVQARQVRATRSGLQPGELELTGTLQSWTGDQAVVAGLSVSTVGAEIKAGVAVGGLIKLHAIPGDGGTWVARELELYVPTQSDSSSDDNSGQDDSPEFLQGKRLKIVGTLEEIGDGFVVVGGQIIDIRNAEVDANLTVGALVKLEATLSDGGLVAHEIERARSFFNDNDTDNDNSDDVSNDNDNDNGNTNDNLNSNTGVPVNCVVTQPAGWTTYTVRRGDTLSAIARGAGSTTNELAAVNCITNARFIRVGQQIFVPRQPAANLTNDNNDNRDDDNWNDNDDNDDRENSNDNEDDDHDDNRNANVNDNDNHSDNEDDD